MNPLRNGNRSADKKTEGLRNSGGPLRFAEDLYVLDGYWRRVSAEFLIWHFDLLLKSRVITVLADKTARMAAETIVPHEFFLTRFML
ncbi:MAG TPA: hypothetical protein DCZ54_02715 [Candidatus Vogelbacteria bacterium]|nr:hypothetical protein [Candidatus Vogelbacteria bacterium]